MVKRHGSEASGVVMVVVDGMEWSEMGWDGVGDREGATHSRGLRRAYLDFNFHSGVSLFGTCISYLELPWGCV